MHTRDVAMTPDGKEIYFCVSLARHRYSAILWTQRVDDRWTAPEVAPFANDPGVMDIEPCISPDGQRFFFLSDRPDTARGETEGDADIWVMDRTSSGWGEPYNLGPPVNSDAAEYFPSVTRSGTLYFTRAEPGQGTEAIYRSRLEGGQYGEPERLGPEVNSGATRFNAFVAPDESYLIVCVIGGDDGVGGTDYYISFRNDADVWTGPVNMGEKINTPGHGEHSPYVSPDGKYFFFMSSRTRADLGVDEPPLTYRRLAEMHNQPQNGDADIYWVDASFIGRLRPE
jgi:Tol biopolymer transport system component